MTIPNFSFYEFLIFVCTVSVGGYLSGFFTVKVNHLLVIILGKLSNGRSQNRYAVIGSISAAICFVILFSFINQIIIPVLLTSIFTGLYFVGVKHAQRRFREALGIMGKVIEIMYQTNSPKSDSIHDTIRIAKGIFNSMPKSNAEALLLLFFFFDSITTVFLVSMINGRFRARRFINLRKEEQKEYLQAWAESEYLFYAIQALKSLVSFSYYSSKYNWQDIRYNGEFLRKSYLG